METTVKRAAPGPLLVGYGKADITPAEPVPLGGYGNSMKRISTEVRDPLCASCIAVTDEAGETVLLFGIDVGGTGGVLRQMRSELARELGLADERVIFSASHTHAAPDLWLTQHPTIAAYIPFLKKQLCSAANMALADRLPGDLYIGAVQTQGLNFVRRYQLSDGRYVGYQSDIKESGLAVTGHETEADKQLQMLKFKRENAKDIFLANFQVHPHRGSSSQSTKISADIVGVFRDKLEKALDCHVIYITGAGGNINSKSEIKEENFTADYTEHGEALAAYALKAQDSLRKVDGGTVRTTVRTFDGTIDRSTESLLPVAKEALAYFKECGNISQTRAKYLPQGIHSPNHANMIINRANKPEQWPFDIWTVSIGDVAFAVAPYEMFDTQGMFIKENSPYPMTVITGYANGGFGYIPSAFAWGHGGYEVDNNYFAQGSAEKLADMYVEMLKEQYAQGKDPGNTL